MLRVFADRRIVDPAAGTLLALDVRDCDLDAAEDIVGLALTLAGLNRDAGDDAQLRQILTALAQELRILLGTR